MSKRTILILTEAQAGAVRMSQRIARMEVQHSPGVNRAMDAVERQDRGEYTAAELRDAVTNILRLTNKPPSAGGGSNGD